MLTALEGGVIIGDRGSNTISSETEMTELVIINMEVEAPGIIAVFFDANKHPDSCGFGPTRKL